MIECWEKEVDEWAVVYHFTLNPELPTSPP
jgi:hypothetical protein